MKSSQPSGLLFALASLAMVDVGAFSSLSIRQQQRTQSAFDPSPSSSPLSALSARKNSNAVEIDEWTSLADDGGVKMRVISSPNDSPSAGAEDFKGKDVTVEYVGSIASRDWSADDVIACWLPDQGLPPLAPKLFDAFGIDGKKLTNAKKFNRKFVFQGLGVLKDAKIDALLSAAKDLGASEKTHPPGTVFDKNRFTFRLGKGMSVRAFDLAVKEMRVGETASLVARCDYAYGGRGLRGSGTFLVPPYATVQFDVTLVEIK
mmetsp:Transcript_50422/g.107388  ORF Transcript_50422/g.107388 Transcript_50422/m.107388 type:complete len:261 (+) Transcript_50422:70-852(+)|eukprot:CAMPEP_0172564544 /NCGR_PEP_ID=MMETSP1067-20121228/104801_1 /TAXON_ID=265564 ORGANISM="Thalassiosira punctigera, Strain Tpunct2005C2" /NCGR_SAMPLE_ID=MMETSP1067 /ASSEMBLY_ACC=CAM_ASM_000444 /LENGTH=260 /DNA_ID=CAMNT_0013355239 /DNA_START=30 /DNA_END=815 /DNA_ORIENTATION=-